MSIHVTGRSKFITVASLCCDSVTAISTRLTQSLGKNVHWYMPRKANPLFTGRVSTLQTLEEKLSAPVDTDSPPMQRVFVLVGMGGAGKSEVAVKFAERNREK